ncbi:hypothetical protein BHM03_00031439 [Ensete ventricosum]|nr:hypothetical protein BHM03_00031439 [Ensete ventricosum]
MESQSETLIAVAHPTRRGGRHSNQQSRGPHTATNNSRPRYWTIQWGPRCSIGGELLLVIRKCVGFGESDVEVTSKKTCEVEKAWESGPHLWEAEDLRVGLGMSWPGVPNLSKRTKALAVAAASVDQALVGPLANAEGTIRWITDD